MHVIAFNASKIYVGTMYNSIFESTTTIIIIIFLMT